MKSEVNLYALFQVTAKPSIVKSVNIYLKRTNCGSSRNVQLELPPSWKLETSIRERRERDFASFSTEEDAMEDSTGDGERWTAQQRRTQKRIQRKEKKGDAWGHGDRRASVGAQSHWAGTLRAGETDASLSNPLHPLPLQPRTNTFSCDIPHETTRPSTTSFCPSSSVVSFIRRSKICQNMFLFISVYIFCLFPE